MARVNRRFYFSRRITSPWPTSWSLRSEEHTSELQSRLHLVCRLLLEKKNNTDDHHCSLTEIPANRHNYSTVIFDSVLYITQLLTYQLVYVIMHKMLRASSTSINTFCK